MYSHSLGVFRHLIRRRGVRFFKSGFPRGEVLDDVDYFDVEELGDLANSDRTRFHVTLTANCILEEKSKGGIEWGVLSNKLIEEGVKNPTTKIFQACLRLDELSTGLSYYNHLLETRQSLTVMDLLFFSKLLLKNKHEIRKYQPLLLKLYDELREHFLSSPLIRKFAMDVFLEIPGCFDEIVSMVKTKSEKVGYSNIIEKALELNRPEVAFEFISEITNFQPTDTFLSNYISFCIKRAKEGVFVQDLIIKLVNLFEEQMICFNSCNVLQNFKTLVDEMNKLQDEYNWSVSESVVNRHTNVCSKCKETLICKPLTQEELGALKDNFYQKIFINKSVYLTSHESELKRFLKFLGTCQPFHIVMDVLNVLYRKKQIGVQATYRSISYFLDRDFSVLLVSRAHSKNVILKALESLPKKRKRNIQMFFTSNISEDDIFILQAALHGGVGTGFLTSDNCNNHFKYVDDSLKKVFLKWQMSHQYLINDQLIIQPPLSNNGVPQLTSCLKNQRYIWHLSHQPETTGRLSRIRPVKWLCLKAIKK